MHNPVVEVLVDEFDVEAPGAERAYARWQEDPKGQQDCQAMGYSEIAEYIYSLDVYWS